MWPGGKLGLHVDSRTPPRNPLELDQSQQLIRRAQTRDRAALEALFAHYAPIVRRGLRRALGESYRRLHGDSEDAAQDALLAAFARIEHYEPRADATFAAWLLRIAELEMLQRLRAARRDKRGGGAVGALDTAVQAVQPDGGDTPTQVARGHELEQRVRACLARMPERERAAIELKRYLQLDTGQIREELGLPSDGAVRALVSRAQVRLAELLDDDS